jgi:hypothetical protein
MPPDFSTHWVSRKLELGIRVERYLSYSIAAESTPIPLNVLGIAGMHFIQVEIMTSSCFRVI